MITVLLYLRAGETIAVGLFGVVVLVIIPDVFACLIVPILLLTKLYCFIICCFWNWDLSSKVSFWFYFSKVFCMKAGWPTMAPYETAFFL